MNTDQLISELGKFPSNKIVNYTGTCPSTNQFISGNFDMVGKKITTTSIKSLRQHMEPLFKRGSVGNVIMRQFTPDTIIMSDRKIPIKNLRGWLIKDGKFARISATEFKEMYLEFQEESPDEKFL